MYSFSPNYSKIDIPHMLFATVSGRHEDDGQVPRWRLRCKRESELEVLNKKLAALNKSMLDKVGGL